MTDERMRELRELLAESVESVTKRERMAFDAIAGTSNEALILFGAGNLGRIAVRTLRRAGVEPLAFADNNPALWNTRVEGVDVMSLVDAAERFGKNATFVVTIWGAFSTESMVQRVRQLESLGCTRVVPFGQLLWKYPDDVLPYYSVDLPHKVVEQPAAVLEAFELWADEPSKSTYLNQLRWRLSHDFAAVSEFCADQTYFPRDLVALTKREVFIDCGAYDGDSIELFLSFSRSHFEKIVAFEPDPRNYERLLSRIEAYPRATRSKIEARREAVGARSERLALVASGSVSSYVPETATAGTIDVESVTLDEAVYDSAPTFVKMDIEGSELDALAGAERVIRDHAPILAICSYHRQSHVWDVPLLIDSFNPGYSFFLRPHEVDIWDLVCYAIPKQRLLQR